MSNQDIANGEYPTVIGADAAFKGELSFEKGVRLLGKFEGEITSKGNLLIADGAQLSGDVKAGSVQINGQMTGNLEATGKVMLAASAKLEGDLRTARLEVADGASFVGKCSVGPANGRPAAAPSSAKSEERPKSAPAASSAHVPQMAGAGKR